MPSVNSTADVGLYVSGKRVATAIAMVMSHQLNCLTSGGWVVGGGDLKGMDSKVYFWKGLAEMHRAQNIMLHPWGLRMRLLPQTEIGLLVVLPHFLSSRFEIVVPEWPWGQLFYRIYVSYLTCSLSLLLPSSFMTLYLNRRGRPFLRTDTVQVETHLFFFNMSVVPKQPHCRKRP